MKLKGLLTFSTSIWRLPLFHSIITTYIFLANVAKTELGVLSKLDSQNMYLWQLNGCVTNFYFRNWQRKFMCTDFLWLENHEPLYNAAAKHFKLTRLFSYNINFYILASAIFYGDKPHKPTSRRSSLWINFKTVKDETRRVFTRLLKALPQIELENVSD